MKSLFLKTFLNISTSYTVIKNISQFFIKAEIDSLGTETGISFKTVALFPGNSLIKFKTSFLETVSKEKFSLPKFSFVFLKLSSFSKFIFPVHLRRFKPLVIFAKYSLNMLEIFLLSLRVWFFTVKIILLLVLRFQWKNA